MSDWLNPSIDPPQGITACWIVLRDPHVQLATELGRYVPTERTFVIDGVAYHPRRVLWWQPVTIPRPPEGEKK